MSGLGTMMAGGQAKTGQQARKRQDDDFYPTPAEVTESLLAVELGPLRGHLGSGEPVWEPACGDGAIAQVLEGHGLRVVGTDLVDRGYGTGGCDFLTVRRGAVPSRVIVTNPPFALAPHFVRQARQLKVRYMALLLKATWWHASTRLPLWREWTPAAIYPLTWRVDFLNLNRPVMDCVWCVWRDHVPGTTVYRPLARPGGTGPSLFAGDDA